MWSLLGSKTHSTILDQNIIVKNTRSSRIPHLRILEQVPIPAYSDLKVNLLEPRKLTAAHGRGPPHDNIEVRWVNPEETEDETDNIPRIDELNVESARGLFEWVCEVDPGKSLNVKLRWEVVAPTGVEWEIL